MNVIDPYELELLMKRFFQCLDEVKLVQTTRTNILKDASRIEDSITGYETVVEYTIKRK